MAALARKPFAKIVHSRGAGGKGDYRFAVVPAGPQGPFPQTPNSLLK